MGTRKTADFIDSMSHYLRRITIVYAFWAMAFGTQLRADSPTYPGWWLERGVVAAQPPAGPGSSGYNATTYDAWMGGNYQLAQVGQAKNMVKAVRDTLDQALPGSAGAQIEAMIAGFSTARENNYVALNLGQLKALAAPIYDKLHADGYATITLADGTVVPAGHYPWDSGTAVSVNYAPANLGQLKHVFSFSLANWATMADSDHNGLLDSWEMEHFGHLGVDPNGDGDTDGLTNREEFLARGNPGATASAATASALGLKLFSP